MNLQTKPSQTAKSLRKNTRLSPFQQKTEEETRAAVAQFNKDNRGKTWLDLQREQELLADQ